MSVLTRMSEEKEKKRRASRGDGNPLRVRTGYLLYVEIYDRETYEFVHHAAAETNNTVREVVERCIAFAKNHKDFKLQEHVPKSLVFAKTIIENFEKKKARVAAAKKKKAAVKKGKNASN